VQGRTAPRGRAQRSVASALRSSCGTTAPRPRTTCTGSQFNLARRQRALRTVIDHRLATLAWPAVEHEVERVLREDLHRREHTSQLLLGVPGIEALDDPRAHRHEPSDWLHLAALPLVARDRVCERSDGIGCWPVSGGSRKGDTG